MPRSDKIDRAKEISHRLAAQIGLTASSSKDDQASAMTAVVMLAAALIQTLFEKHGHGQAVDIFARQVRGFLAEDEPQDMLN